jgi:hypothetical protein
VRPVYILRLVYSYRQTGYKKAQKKSKLCQRRACSELKLELIVTGNVLHISFSQFTLHVCLYIIRPRW